MSKSLSKDHIKLLKRIYYDKKNYYGRDKLFHIVKQYPDHPSQCAVAAWLRTQELYQIHFKPKKSHTIKSIIPDGPKWYFMMDLIDLGKNFVSNSGKRYILTVIDVFTKQAHAKALRDKNSRTVRHAFAKIIKYNGTKSGS